MRQPLLTWFMLATGFAAALAGCELSPSYDKATTAAVKAAEEADAAEAAPLLPLTQEPADPAVAAVQAHADRLAAAHRGGTDAEAQRTAIPAEPNVAPPIANDVMWLVPGGSEEPATVEVSTAVDTEADRAFVSAANTMTVLDTAAEPTARPDIIQPTIFEHIDAASATDFEKALRVVNVNLADPQRAKPDCYIAALNPEQQHAVRLYQDLVRVTYDQLVADAGRLDRDAFTARLDELFGQQPIAIRDLRLCRRVNGYGVYEPFETATFLAGREQRMIVYLELDDFAALDRGDGRFVVDLQQEVTLYSSDGLAVWRNEPVQITDVSANRRRDFFVVQLVKLPQRLNVGRYRMKVRVTDLNGGSIDEQGIDLDFVADRAMVEKPTQETAPLR